jgi:dipeptidyl aminopeptidase/acylaminoacyl peptidase
LLCAAAALPAPLAAAPATGPNRYFTGADLFSLEVATDPQISPDGRTIAYVRKSNDIMTDKSRPTIWLVDVPTGQQRPLLAGSGSYFSPRWSPDGSRLAYVAAEGGSPQLYVRWMVTGESARITGLPDSPGAIAWSPDGRRIAYSMFVPDEAPKLGSAPDKPEGAKWADPLQVIDKVTYRTDEGGYVKPGFEQIFWVPADGGAPTQLTFGATHAGAPVWTPDSRSIIFSANLSKNWEREPVNSEVYRISIDGGAPVPLTNRNGPDASPVVSPDGRYIAYVGFDDRKLGYQNTQLSIMNLDGSGKRVLTSGLDRSVDSPTWSADSRGVYVQVEDRGSNVIDRVGLDGSVHQVASGLTGAEIDRPYAGGEFSVAKTGALAVTVGDALHPSDIGIASGGAVRRLTHLNESLLAAKVLGNEQKLSVASSFDRRPIDAWMILPPDADPAKKYPLILEIHGGPFAAYGPSFSTDDQLYAAHGYAVVYANPRGSTSYGEEFADQIDQNYPSHDYDDLMSTVDAAIATGHVDPNNLFVTGGSGGGVLTAWIVGKTNRFRAAATQKPVINWASFELTSDGATFFSPYWFAKKPWEDPMGYWARSPLSLVGNVRTPTLVVVGSDDYRTPDSEAEQYYEALQLRGVPTEFVKVPGASHGGIAARPSQAAAKASAILAWFDRYRTASTAAAGSGAAAAAH